MCWPAQPTASAIPVLGSRCEGYPTRGGEVRYACREHAVTIEDIAAAKDAPGLPQRGGRARPCGRVAEIMSEELSWVDAEPRAATAPTPTTM